MSMQNLCYPVCLILNGREQFLIWRDGGDQPDEYIINPKAKEFWTATNLSALRESAKASGIQLAEQEPALVDMDKMFKTMAGLRSARPASERACHILLDGWNTLEDMARALHLQINLGDNTIRKAYDKLFYGNNLPAITPHNESYSPILSSDERKAMRCYLRFLWSEILKRNRQFGAYPNLMSG